MNIIYLVSLLVLLIAFILRKKTEKAIDILNFICISIVLLFCYNTILCYILTFFTISNNLLILTIINFLFILILMIPILKRKEIQKYMFKKIDIIFISILAVIILVVSYINFGFPFNIKYETGDPSVHYLTSIMFAESETLLAAAEPDQVYGSFNVRKTMSYVNSGLLMKCLSDNLEPIQCYNIFVVFGIFILFLTGLEIYSALKIFANNNKKILIAFIVSLLCTLGYPLNSLLFGFEYLSMGLLVIATIINFIYYYKEEIFEFKFIVIVFLLLNFGLFSSYYMFVPFIYPATWIFFCIENYKKTKKIVTKELVILLLLTLLLPFVLGYIYHLAPNIYAILINKTLDIDKVWNYSNYIAGDGLATNGYIYINLYSNVILLFPLAIYLFVIDIKENKLNKELFLFLLLIFTVGFIGILLIGNYFGKVSMYYLSKNYFALWIILAFCNYKALLLLAERNNYIMKLLISSYILLFIIYTAFTNTKMINSLTNPYENILTVMEIFGVNKDMLLNKKEVYNQEEIEILMYARENLDYNKKIEVASDDTTWTYVMLRYINREPSFEGKKGGENYLVSKWLLLPEKVNKVDYMLFFKKSKMYKFLEEKLYKNAEIIFENEAGGILKYNN